MFMFIAPFGEKKMIPIAAMLGASLGSAALNAGSTLFQNYQNKKWSDDMYNRQLGDQWEFYNAQKQDSLAFWRMQNAYNDPSAQAARMRAAGLNPDFANINPGEAGSIGTPSGAAPSMAAPQAQNFMLGSVIDGAFEDTLKILTSYQTLEKQGLEIQQTQGNLTMDLFDKMIGLKNIDPSKLPDIKAGPGEITPSFIASTSYEDWLKLAPGISKKDAARYSSAFEEYLRSDRAKSVFSGNKNKYEAELEAWRNRNSNPLFNASYDMMDAAVELAKMELDLRKKYLNTTSKKYSTEQSEYALRKMAADMEENVRGKFFEMYKKGNFNQALYYYRAWLRLGSDRVAGSGIFGSIRNAAIDLNPFNVINPVNKFFDGLM